MNIFNIISLLGGLAMFLYGMRLMGDGLKEGSSGTLKSAMEHVTNNPITAFLLGVVMTALIQSSTATIVITAGLVGAGIISLKQSLGIIIGANVGTTVTGQIIRLLDVDASGTAWLQFFKPSTLAPIALIIGIVLIMFFKFKNSKTVGSIAIGFGILFSGLLNMTGAVSSLSEGDTLLKLFAGLGDNPVLGYLTGAGVAFALQSSSATIGILQAFAQSGALTFKCIYAVIVGIYLGDCVTTAIVCSIGAKPDAKRVGIVNILFNLSETVVVLLVVTILHKVGVLDKLWNKVVTSGMIANTNTIFNLGCAILLFPCLGLYEKLSKKIIRDEKTSENKYSALVDAMNPSFYVTPALALKSSYDALSCMFDAARNNFETATRLLRKYDEKTANQINMEEENIDFLADKVTNYLVGLSPHLQLDDHMAISNQYYKVIQEFERLGDHAVNICDCAEELYQKNVAFSEIGLMELNVLEDIISKILSETELAFKKQNVEAASHIEPLEEVVDDLVSAMKERHLERLRSGNCNVEIDPMFLNLLSDLERISDICSNVGITTIARANPELANLSHQYISHLHSGHDEFFNVEYSAAHQEYFNRLGEITQ